MNRFLLALLLVSVPVQAADTLIVTKAGYFLLTQDSAGVPSVKKIDHVIKFDDPSTPEKPPDPTSQLETHRKSVQVATDKVTDPNKTNTKKALAELYRTSASLPVLTRDQLAQTTNLLFGALNIPLWAPWKATIDQSLSGFSALDDAKKAWQVVAEVLEK